MDYPDDFPSECKPDVDTAIANAEIAMSKAKRSGRSMPACIRDYAKTVHVAYCFAICQAVYLNHWSPERARKEMQRHLRKLMTDIYYQEVGSVNSIELEKAVHDVRNEIEWKNSDWEEIQTALKRAIEKQEQAKRDKEFDDLRLGSLLDPQPAKEQPAQEQGGSQPPLTARESYLLPILELRGMSRSKWATMAGVDPSAVYDYLAEKSDPRPDTRKALADAIGLNVTDLPR